MGGACWLCFWCRWMLGSFESVGGNACVHRLYLRSYSHSKQFWRNGVRTHVNSKGKIPSTEKLLRRGGPNPRCHIQQDSKPNTLPTSYSGLKFCKCMKWMCIQSVFVKDPPSLSVLCFETDTLTQPFILLGFSRFYILDLISSYFTVSGTSTVWHFVKVDICVSSQTRRATLQRCCREPWTWRVLTGMWSISLWLCWWR